MTIAIIAAMEEEADVLRNKICNCRTLTIAGCRFDNGTLAGEAVVLMQSGIGKVNAALGTALLIDRFHPDAVINTGSAGGTDPALQIGDVIISDGVFHHDVDATAFGYAPGQVPGMPETYRADARLVDRAVKAAPSGMNAPHYLVGTIGSGDVFMADDARLAALKVKFPAMKAVEMEAAAIAQTCYRFGVPFIIIRALSDIAGSSSAVSFNQFLKTAATHSAAFVLDFIQQIKE
ncbi:MAG: 5'-methylthioadenosine/S-adenosylhomocysteine nucleosidase [Sporolactobacillus sp.]